MVKKTETAAKAPRQIGRPAKAVAELRTIRPGTTRDRLLQLMNGTRTAEQIAKTLGTNSANVMSHAHCLHRDCGLGYRRVDGLLTVVYPGQKTYADVVVAKEKAVRAPRPKKVAKKKAAKKVAKKKVAKAKAPPAAEAAPPAAE